MKLLFFGFSLLISLLAGCATGDESSINNASPTSALIRGDINSSDYFSAVTAANKKARADEQFEVDREPTRAYNTKTGKVEFIPEDTQQSWNDTNKRWEFTPITP